MNQPVCAVCHEPKEDVQPQYGGVSPWLVCRQCIAAYWRAEEQRKGAPFEPWLRKLLGLDLMPKED